jgi:putative transposase
MVHLMFKVKYCHAIFKNPRVEKRCAEVLEEAAQAHGMRIDTIGFGKDHLHALCDIGLNSADNAVRYLKGRTAKYLLREFPEMKRRYFWGSGLWNPSYWADSVGMAQYETIKSYVQRQKSHHNEPDKNQSRITDYLN